MKHSGAARFDGSHAVLAIGELGRDIVMGAGADELLDPDVIAGQRAHQTIRPGAQRADARIRFEGYFDIAREIALIVDIA
jgi:hypothetical protein